MKKLLIVLLSLLISFSLTSCKTERKKEITGDSILPKYTDMDSFLSDWKQAQKEPNDSPLYQVDGESSPTLIFPVLISSEFELRSIYPDDYSHVYVYQLLDADASFDMYETGLIVGITNTDLAFETVMEQHNLTPDENDIAYYSEHNEWYVNQGGRCIKIQFPDDLILSSADELKEYFSFEEITLPEGEYYQKPKHTPKIILFCSIGAGVVAISAVTAVLIVKKRKKKATA